MESKKQFSVEDYDEILASGWQRFGNYIIDIIFIYIVMFFLAFVCSIITALLGLNGFNEWLQTISDLEANLIFIAMVLIYYIIFETLLSRSLSKFITGTIVVYEDGSKPDLGTITKRTLCRFIPFEVFSFLGGARGWHDSISDTYVVSKKGLETKMKLFTELDEIGVNQEI